MTDTKCLDTSAWLSYYFQQHRSVKEHVEQLKTLLITSSLSLFEIKKRLIRLKKDPSPFLHFVKQRSMIIAPGVLLAEHAAEISVHHKLAAVDAMIYATAKSMNVDLITADSDFKGLDHVEMLPVS